MSGLGVELYLNSPLPSLFWLRGLVGPCILFGSNISPVSFGFG